MRSREAIAGYARAVPRYCRHLLHALLVALALVSASLSAAAPYIDLEVPISSPQSGADKLSHFENELSRATMSARCDDTASNCSSPMPPDSCCHMSCHANAVSVCASAEVAFGRIELFAGGLEPVAIQLQSKLERPPRA